MDIVPDPAPSSLVHVSPTFRMFIQSEPEVVELQLGNLEFKETSIYKSLIREKNVTINNLQAEIMKLREEKDVLDMTERIRIELNQNSHNDTYRLDINQLQKELDITKKILKSVRDELCDALHHRKLMEIDMDKCRIRVSELEEKIKELNDRGKSLEHTIVEKDQNMNLLGMQLTEAKMVHKSETAALRMKLDMCHQEVAAERIRNGQLCGEIAVLKKALDENTQNLCLELRDLGSLLTKNEFLEERLTENKNVEALLMEDLEKTKSELKELREKCVDTEKSAERTYKYLCEENVKVKQQKADLRCEIIELRRENDKLRKERDDKVETITGEQMVREQHTEIDVKFANQEIESRQLRTEIEKLTKKISLQDDILLCQKRQILEMKQDNCKLQERISEVIAHEKFAVGENEKLRKQLANEKVTDENNQGRLKAKIRI